MQDIVEPLPDEIPVFAGSSRTGLQNVRSGDLAVLGARSTYSYSPERPLFPSWQAPDAIRAASIRYEPFLANFDFDAGSVLFGDKTDLVVDCGNASDVEGDFSGNSERITKAVRHARAAGATPVVLGGDDAIPVPVIRAFDDIDRLCIIQLDAHVDWRHERNGVTEGLSSNMRRASEMPFVTRMMQIGVRGAGSASAADVTDAIEWGSHIVTMDDVRHRGIDAILRRLPSANGYFLAIDMDVFDPSIVSAVNSPSFGGLSYREATRLIDGIAQRGPIVGIDCCELAPDKDTDGVSSMLAARLLLDAMGSIVRARSINDETGKDNN